MASLIIISDITYDFDLCCFCYEHHDENVDFRQVDSTLRFSLPVSASTSWPWPVVGFVQIAAKMNYHTTRLNYS